MIGENKNNRTPKVLVISHNCFSKSQSNGRTLESFFKKWDSKKLAQLYFYNNRPDSEVCNNFYRITDQEILKSIFFSKSNRNNCKTQKITERKIKHKKGSKTLLFLMNFFYFLKNKTNNLFILLRDLMWRRKVFNEKNLKEWVYNFKPEIILLYPGEYPFIYRIALDLATTNNIPLVIFNSENHFIKKRHSISPFYHLYKYLFNKIFEKTFYYSKYIIHSNDLLKADFDLLFNIPSLTILTSSEIYFELNNSKKNIIKISYAGNLGHERWKSLVKIGKLVKAINKELSIEVYSGYLPKEAKKHFTIENGIDFKGVVSYDKVMRVINESDIVIHTEGFSNFTKWDISHGFSTKIGDLLSSGKCFLMYGPKEIACVDYLIKNKAAWVATSDKELKEVLNKIINVENERGRYLENAKKLVEERHNMDKNCEIFEKLMAEVYHSN